MDASTNDDVFAPEHADSIASSPSAPQKTRNGQHLSPKRPLTEKAGLADLFPYYAGFSFDWACEQIRTELDHDAGIVFDPWNGSGTTSTAARHTGHSAVGVDLNPVANVIAALRSHSFQDLSEQRPPSSQEYDTSSPTEPLTAWFSPSTAARLRTWVDFSYTRGHANSKLVLTAVFKTVRLATRRFEGSNPTWVRHAKRDEPLVNIDNDAIDAGVVAEQRNIIARMSEFASPRTPVTILTAAAQNLPLANNCIDYTLTSPPYFTRIDYAVAYARELAVLGLDVRGSNRNLRGALMGTTLIRKNQAQAPLGFLAENLIKKISSHQSKDSSGYYKKQATQYFDDLARTLDEITRVASTRSTLQLVVQDSYYKDIHVCLADIYREEACRRGWEFDSATTFDVIRSLTSLNTPARAYSKDKVNETMLTLRRNT